MSVLRRTAEKIRSAIEVTSFVVEKNSHLNITISIGAALHDGHPDFLRTITLTKHILRMKNAFFCRG